MKFNNYLNRQLYDWPIITGNNSNTYSSQETLPANLIQKNNFIINTSTNLVVSNGTIYGVDKNQINKLNAIDMTTNTTKWQYVVEGEPHSIASIIATGKMIFLFVGLGIIALEDTGNNPVLKWSKPGYISSFTYNDNKIYYITTGENLITAIVVVDSTTGNEIKRFSIGKSQDSLGVITVGGGRLYFTLGASIRLLQKQFNSGSNYQYQ